VVRGTKVDVVEKEHQRSGQATLGNVARSLGSSPYHPRGIKVVLECGTIGRVVKVHDAEEPVDDPGELRVDEADGEGYAKDDFLAEYGDLVRWSSAPLLHP
jgi:uncharacterized repeat protein (TIGR03833 family)